jgi:hypothetical protein
MTDLKCPACVIRVIDPGGPGEWRDPSCTGRPGCVRAEMEEMIQRAEAAGWTFSHSTGGVDIVRHPDRENPAPESGPEMAGVPVGKAGLADGERMAARWAALAEGPAPLGTTPEMRELVREYGRFIKRGDKDAEIARLRAEVERLTRQVDHWIGYARTTETHAARLEDRRADLAARVTKLEAEVERLTGLLRVVASLAGTDARLFKAEEGGEVGIEWGRNREGSAFYALLSSGDDGLGYTFFDRGQGRHRAGSVDLNSGSNPADLRAYLSAARDIAVAEAVREACKQAVTGTYGDARNHHRMDAINLAAVLTGVTGEEG